jgi:F0F1-type ATP synthase assembly protein I
VSDGTPRPDRSGLRQLGLLSTVGLTLVIATMLGYWGGRALDGWLGTAPWLGLAGLVFGVAAGFVNLFRVVSRLDGSERDRGR